MPQGLRMSQDYKYVIDIAKTLFQKMLKSTASVFMLI